MELVTSEETREPEPRWPAVLGTVAIAGLYISLPERLTLGPSWAFVAAVLVGITAAIITNRLGRHDLNRAIGFLLLGIVTVGLSWSLGMLIAGLPGKKEPPTDLLRSAVALWSSNVLVFASWYWRLDAGGPHARDRRTAHTEGAFLFPANDITPRLKSHEERVEARVCGLPVSGVQYQHCVFADRCAGAFALGEGSDDGAKRNFTGDDRDFSGAGDQCFVKGGGQILV